MRIFSDSAPSRHDVLIVGAGPAGSKASGVENLGILDRRRVGASFENWPAQMRMIIPRTSVADYLGREHPSGPEYARYLRAVADFDQLPVESRVEAISVKKKGHKCDVASEAAAADAEDYRESRGLFGNLFITRK